MRNRSSIISSTFLAVANKIKSEDYAAFSALGYQDRVRFFDKRFQVVPFPFPKADVECSWFTNEMRYNQLVEFLNSENGNKNIYARAVRHRDGEAVFDVRPVSKAHRILFNQFVVAKFLAAKNDLAQQLSHEYKHAADPLLFLESRQARMLAVVDWAKLVLLEQKFSLRHQFLRVFFNGYLAYQNVNDELVKVRRRFVELFLHSQGLLLAAHLDDLACRIQMHKTDTEKKPMSLSQKIFLLQELGVIELLRKKIREDAESSGNDLLPELIGLICTDKPVNRHLLAKHISEWSNLAQTNTGNEHNIALVRSELARFGL